MKRRNALDDAFQVRPSHPEPEGAETARTAGRKERLAKQERTLDRPSVPLTPSTKDRLEATNEGPVGPTEDRFAARTIVPSETSSATQKEPQRVLTGAMKQVRHSLARFSAGAGAASAIEEGTTIIELDPSLIESSFIADRMVDETDSSMADLIESMRESGQQVPILVRPCPEKPGRYQTAYGHRRARAAAALGRPVRAVVKALSDAELVVAQGKENLERRDLSYIEKAFFAMRLEGFGFGRAVISSAMGVYKPDVSNFIKVAREVPEQVVRAIGPAPKAGGPRWRLLVERIKSTGNRYEEVIASAEFAIRATDDRFVVLFEALVPKAPPKTRQPEIFRDTEGRKVARIEETDDRYTVSIDRNVEPDFGVYLRDRLPEILAAFRAGRASPAPQSQAKGDEKPE